MVEKSKTEKLQELFDLLNSGAITKEEYDTLKADLINDYQSSRQEGKDSAVAPPNENSSQEAKGSSNQGKNRKIFIIATIVVLIVAITSLVFLLPNSKRGATKESQITFATWDEAMARKIITEELKKHLDWGFSCNYKPQDLQFNIGRFNHVKVEGREAFVVLTGTQLNPDVFCPPCCWTEASVFEFENNDGWQLYQKALGFAGINSNNDIKFYETGTGNYSIQITSVTGGGRGDTEEPRTEISKFTFIDKKLVNVE